jgi:hypothetical protein
MDISGVEREIDITMSGDFSVDEVSIDVDFESADMLDLDVSVSVDGISTSIVESQVVSYDKILDIDSNSPEITHEKRYASSAYASKKISDSLSSLTSDVNLMTGSINGLDSRVKVLESYDLSGGGSGDSYWIENNGAIETQRDVYIDGNLIVTGDISAS